MGEATEVAILARNANAALQEATQQLHLARNSAINAIGMLSIINSGNLASAVASIRVAVREIDGQLEQFHIASVDIESYRSRLE